MKRLAIVSFLIVAACSTTSNGRGQISQLRARGGLCTSVSPTMVNKITTCAIVGQPGTLDDDGRTPFLVTTVTGPANAPSADTGSWQLEIFRGQELVSRGRMSKNWPPELNCIISPCTSWSLAGSKMPFDWTPGIYSFRYTLAFDTSVVATNTLTIQ